MGQPVRDRRPAPRPRPADDPREAIERYEAGIDDARADEIRRELHGRDLVCWCTPGAACHAGVLLTIANPD